MKSSELSLYFLTTYSFNDEIITVEGYIGLFFKKIHSCMLEFDLFMMGKTKIMLRYRTSIGVYFQFQTFFLCSLTC